MSRPKNITIKIHVFENMTNSKKIFFLPVKGLLYNWMDFK